VVKSLPLILAVCESHEVKFDTMPEKSSIPRPFRAAIRELLERPEDFCNLD
jgi:hypothetical protein